MYKKHKVPCPNCHEYKLVSWSPAGLSLTLLLGAVVTACVPIIGWLLIIPLGLLAAALVPVTLALYLIPKMRVVTVKCRRCEWKGQPNSLQSLQSRVA
jgi:hypothetical protein